MTARQVFEATLIELSKVNAPSLKLYEFNYLFNKAINQYINKVYNIYDINQQTTDDIRVLKSTAYLNPVKISNNNNSIQQSLQGNNGANYEVALPQDYLHILNCTCVYYVSKNISCYNAGDYIEIPALRLTADSWSGIITDVYNRPSPMRPYYYIHNVNKQNDLPTDIYDVNTDTGTDQHSTTEFPKELSLKLPNSSISVSANLVNKEAYLRASNPSKVRCEIRYGKDNSIYQLRQVVIDYIKSPQNIRLTQQQIDLTEDTSQIMEFPDYVNQEIINELVHLVMERENNPRLSNHIQMTQSIVRPTQQQTQQTT